MYEAATHQLRVELKCGQKETKAHLEEAQQEYDSQFAHCFYSSIPPEYHLHVQSLHFL